MFCRPSFDLIIVAGTTHVHCSFNDCHCKGIVVAHCLVPLSRLTEFYCSHKLPKCADVMGVPVPSIPGPPLYGSVILQNVKSNTWLLNMTITHNMSVLLTYLNVTVVVKYLMNFVSKRLLERRSKVIKKSVAYRG